MLHYFTESMMLRSIFICIPLTIICGCIEREAHDTAVLQSALLLADAPVPLVERVLIVSVDGLRPDMLLRAAAPNVRRLMRTGSFTFYARTAEVAWTLPAHATMLTGVSPDRHGLLWDVDIPKANRIYSRRPTIFQLAKAKGYTTAMAVGKSKLNQLAKPGSLDWEFIPEEYAQADQVAAHAVDFIRLHKPQVFFLHFADVDGAGHGNGWGSEEQVEAVAKVDAALGVVLETLRQQKLFETTAIIFTSDHGGSGIVHGAGDIRSRLIPWIISGPGIRQNLDLTGYHDLEVNTEDTFATACFLLHIPVDGNVEGKPVMHVLKSQAEAFPLDYTKAEKNVGQ